MATPSSRDSKAPSVEWATPQWLFDQLCRTFSFELDPCATADNAKCKEYYSRKTNGLDQVWAPRRVFMNPPYGRTIGHWVDKAVDESRRGALVVGLLPVRTSARWWNRTVWRAAEIHFIQGRLRFGDGLLGAPFSSAIVVWRPGCAGPPAIRYACRRCGQPRWRERGIGICRGCRPVA